MKARLTAAADAAVVGALGLAVFVALYRGLIDTQRETVHAIDLLARHQPEVQFRGLPKIGGE